MPSYRGYDIRQTTHQGLPAYRVKTPNGTLFAELATSKQVACKWVDMDILERRH